MSCEFKRGDKVTFNAYKQEQIPATVVECISRNKEQCYRLEGDGKPLVTITSARSIRESKHFVEPSEWSW